LTHRLLQLAPLLATCVLAAGLLLPHGPGAVMIGAALLALAAAVTAAVHHAEVVALRVGEPFGTLVLALAVTVIEVSLILSVMLAGGEQQAALPRDTIYAAVMIICNGVVGLCLLVGGLRHHEQSFRIEGAGSGLAALIALATLSLVLPTFTVSSPIGTYTDSQLAFVGTMSLLLWGVFVFVQTVRHRDYFLPPGAAADAQAHAAPPTRATTAVSLGLLLLSLVAVVGLAKLLSPAIERAVAGTASPSVLVAIAIALLVLLPETWAAVRAARANRLQTSLNLAIGSALASIGLTIPAVVTAAVWLDLPLTLGLVPRDITLLALTFLVATVTLGSGKTSLMQGAVHLVLFAAFLFLSLVP
jgi:Ca2+:H+ antiporter